MKINQIIINETSAGATGSGSVATVSSPLGKTMSRNSSIYGDKKVGSLFKGKKTSKPYANSLSEGRMGELDYDLKNMKPSEFQKKYGMTRQEMLAKFKQQPQPKSTQVPVQEEKLEEEDKIIAVGKGKKLKTGLHGKDEQPKFRNFAAPFKSAGVHVSDKRGNSVCDCSNEDIAPIIVKALNAYATANESMHTTGGVIAGGGVGESQGDPYDFLKVGKWVKFGMWNKPQEHKIGRIMKIENGMVTVVIDGGPYSGKMVDLNLGNKSLSISPATEPNKGLAGIRNESVNEGAYDDGFDDGRNDRENPRASSIYGPSIDKYRSGFKAGLQKREEEKQERAEKYKAKIEPYLDIPTDELKELYKAAKERELEIREIYNKLRGTSYDFDPKRHTPKNHEELSVEFKKLRNQVEAIYDVLSSRKEGVAEGAKVDRMVGHIKKSEIKAGKSKDEAENIAWATVNKRGYLDNKNKKAK